MVPAKKKKLAFFLNFGFYQFAPYLYIRMHLFLVIIEVAGNCAQHMGMQAVGSNPLSGSIIFFSVCTSGGLRALCNFLY